MHSERERESKDLRVGSGGPANDMVVTKRKPRARHLRRIDVIRCRVGRERVQDVFLYMATHSIISRRHPDETLPMTIRLRSVTIYTL